MKTAPKLGLLGALYLSQGLPFGFFTQAMPVMMRERGISLEDIGLTSLLALPWALKFIWAPLVDRFGWPRVGLRRSWILPLQGLAIVTLLVLSRVDPSALGVVLVGVFVVNLLAATQDIATDGLAVTLLDRDERGLGNGLQVAGYRMGMIIGGGALLIVHDRLGWSNVFLVMAGLLLVASIPIGLHREREAEPGERAPRPSYWRELTTLAKRPGMGVWFVVLVCYKAGEHFATSMLKPMLSDYGLSLEDIGWLTGTAGFVAGLVGALVGGALVGVLGRFRSLVAFGVLQALAVGAYALLTVAAFRTWDMLYALIIAEYFVSGMATASLFTLMMDASRPGPAAGTDYTVQASLYVISPILITAVAGFSAAGLGYTQHYLLAGGLCLLALVPVFVFLSRGGADLLAAAADEPGRADPRP